MNSESLYEKLNIISENEFEDIKEYNPISKKLKYNFKKNIKSFIKKETNNIYLIQDNNKNEKEVYIKYITLVDFLKYLIGKYKDDNIENIEIYDTEEEINSKYKKYINDTNNYAYVDSLFYNITNDLLKKYNFLHGIECFDTFVCKKKNCKINITDDLEYLCD